MKKKPIAFKLVSIQKIEDLPIWKQKAFKALENADKLSRQYTYTVINPNLKKV